MNTKYSERVDQISNELFGKKADDIKFLMVTDYLHDNLLHGEDCLRTGLYSWIPAMRGQVMKFQDIDPSTYEDYDIIQVNMSAQDIHILGDIREVIGKDSRTKLVANNDYTLELWGASFPHLNTLKREIKHADMIFGTEEYQTGALELLTGNKIYLITHPCFTKRLKTLNIGESANGISVVSHRYDNNNIIPTLALKNINVNKRLIGYDTASDKNHFKTTTYYHKIFSGTNYMDFCDQLLASEVVYDPFSLTSQGRVGWDCAALGVPVVGSDRNRSYRLCFPKTCCDPYDVKTANKLIKRLLEDNEFRKEVIDYAQKMVEEVSYEHSKLLYFEALYENTTKE